MRIGSFFLALTAATWIAVAAAPAPSYADDFPIPCGKLRSWLDNYTKLLREQQGSQSLSPEVTAAIDNAIRHSDDRYREVCTDNLATRSEYDYVMQPIFDLKKLPKQRR